MKPTNMDSPEGPTCGCGKPSTRESGLCESCFESYEFGFEDTKENPGVSDASLRRFLVAAYDGGRTEHHDMVLIIRQARYWQARATKLQEAANDFMSHEGTCSDAEDDENVCIDYERCPWCKFVISTSPPFRLPDV